VRLRRSGAEGPRVGKIDTTAEGCGAVAGDDLGEGERERPGELGGEARGGTGGAHQGGIGGEDFTGGDEEFASAEHIEDGLPAVGETGDAVEL
jgi:hypothetical protein